MNREGERYEGKELHEINRYQDAAFPVGMYVVTKESIFPGGRGYMDLHWHEELQFTMVTEGQLQMQVNGQNYLVEKGQAIFINRNYLHITTGLTDGGSYVSFNFPDKLLGFFSGSRMEQDDVLPFTSQYGVAAVVLKPETDWQKMILDNLRCMQELFYQKNWGRDSETEKERKNTRFEYRISLMLAENWLNMILNIGKTEALSSGGSVRKQERIRSMLTFIHENYMNPIKLNEIAASANVSEGECCRCFKEMIRKSPNQYLVAYRISRGMELLSSSEKSVTEIAVETGFNDVSHFIRYFKRQTGVTPKNYRKGKC